MNAEHCIRCTICVENCPVFRINPDFPGPKQAGPDAQRFRSEREKSEDGWVLLCSQCKRCDLSCPSGVNPAEIILKQQQRYGREHFQSLSHVFFANMYSLSRLGSLTAPLTNALTASTSGKWVLKKMGISTQLPFPKFRWHTMRRVKTLPRGGAKKVAFFYGCFINFYRPDIGKKIIRLLESMKVDVVLPPQGCCGLPALGNGNIKLARTVAQKNAESLVSYIDAGYDIVYSCTSCGLCLLHDYPGILNIVQARRIAEHTYNLYEYINKLVDEESFAPPFGEIRKHVAYHIPCHLRALKIGYPAYKLMASIPGLTCEILEDTCCGLSGSYGFKEENAFTSLQIGRRAVAAIRQTGADCLMADCGSCRIQLGELSGLPALDPVEILYDALHLESSTPHSDPAPNRK